MMEALQSPVGSSKRQLAKTLFSTVSRTAQKRFDGQGGPGVPLGISTLSPISMSTNNPWDRFALPPASQNNMVPPLAPAPPRGKDPNWKKVPNDGQGGSIASSVIPVVKDIWSNFATNAIPSFVEEASKPVASPGNNEEFFRNAKNAVDYTLGGAGVNTALGAVIPGAAGMNVKFVDQKKPKTTQTPTAQSPYPQGSDMDMKLNAAFKRMQNGTASDIDRKNISYAQGKGWAPAGTQQTGAPQGAQKNNIIPTDILTSLGKKFTQDQGSASHLITSPMGPGAQNASIAQVPTSPMTFGTGDQLELPSGEIGTTTNMAGWGAVNAAITNAAGQFLGPEATVQYVMNDPAAMAELRKMFPGVPDKYILANSNIALHLQELNERLKEETGLNAIIDERDKAKSMGYGLQDTMVSYIKGRDEYFTNIDKMIDKATADYLSKGNADDPGVQREYKQYLDYLQTLKGRQYQRYTDALTKSTNQYNDTLNRLDNEYAMTLDKYNEQVKMADAISENVYKDMYNTITSLYNGVDTALKGIDDNQYAYQELFSNADGTLNLTATQKKAGEGDYMKGKTLVESFIDPNSKTLSPTTNIMSILQTAQNNQYDVNALYGVIDQLGSTLSGELTNPPSDNGQPLESSDDTIKRITNILKTWQEGIADYAPTSQEGVGIVQKMTNMINQVSGTIGEQYKKTIAGKGSALKKAIQELIKPSREKSWWLPQSLESKKPYQNTSTDRAEFIKNSGLDESLGGIIFDLAMKYPSDPAAVFTGGENINTKSDQEIESMVADILASSNMTSNLPTTAGQK